MYCEDARRLKSNKFQLDWKPKNPIALFTLPGVTKVMIAEHFDVDAVTEF